MYAQHARWVSLWMLLPWLAAIGCSDRVATYPVEGRIECGGQPVDHARVVFHPLGEHTLGTLRPHARTDAAGRYRLSTYGVEDGAPPGEYKVTLEWGASPVEFAGWSPTEIPEEELGSGPDRLEARYADPQSTPLSIIVTADQHELPLLTVQ